MLSRLHSISKHLCYNINGDNVVVGGGGGVDESGNGGSAYDVDGSVDQTFH